MKKLFKSREDVISLVFSVILAVITLHIWHRYSYLNALIFVAGANFMLFTMAVILRLLVKYLEKLVKELEEKENMHNEH